MAEPKLFYSAFDLVSQPVILVKKQLVVYMNSPARVLLRKDFVGKPAALLFPSYITNTQADSFATTAVIGDTSFAVRASSAEGHKVYVLDSTELSIDNSTRLIMNIGSQLTNINCSMKYLLSITEIIKDDGLSGICKTLNHGLYSFNRSFRNLSLMRHLADGSMPFAPETLDITEMLKNLLRTVRVVSAEKQLNFNLNAEEHVRINADKTLLEDLLLNLFANSISHCRENGRISVSVLRGDKHLIISVDYDGDGISSDELAAVFKKYRTDIDLTQSNDGNGMGLAIVRGIAELHGGTIIIESRGKDMGTSVRVMLSYSTKVSENFRTSVSDYSAESMTNILTQLSPCLSDDCYGGLFED